MSIDASTGAEIVSIPIEATNGDRIARATSEVHLVRIGSRRWYMLSEVAISSSIASPSSASTRLDSVCGTKLSNGDHCVLKPFHLGNCEPPVEKVTTTTPATQTYAGAVGDLYRKQDKSPTFVHQGEKVVAFPDDAEPESNDSYVPFVGACERFNQTIKHWSKTTHADWLRSMTKQDVIKLINASKANDKIGVGNKGHNEAVASYSISRLPFMEQYVNEYDAIGTTTGVNAGAPSNPNPRCAWTTR